MDNNIFEQGTRLQVRFATDKGLLSIEDLWGLPLTGRTSNANLDDIAKSLHKEIRNMTDEVSFVNPDAGGDTSEARLRFNIVKHIIDVRLAETKAAKEAAQRKERDQRILEIIDRKQGQELEGKSIDELRALLRA